MHQITVIEPKWLSEVAPTFFRVADMNKISKRKQGEKIEPLYDRFAADKDDWVSHSAMPSTCTDCVASQQTGARRQVVADIRSGFVPLVNGQCCVVQLSIHALFAVPIFEVLVDSRGRVRVFCPPTVKREAFQLEWTQAASSMLESRYFTGQLNLGAETAI